MSGRTRVLDVTEVTCTIDGKPVVQATRLVRPAPTPPPVKYGFATMRSVTGMAHCPGCGHLQPLDPVGIGWVVTAHRRKVIVCDWLPYDPDRGGEPEQGDMWKDYEPPEVCRGSGFLVQATARICGSCQRPCMEADQWCFLDNCCIWCDDTRTTGTRDGPTDVPCAEGVRKYNLWRRHDDD